MSFWWPDDIAWRFFLYMGLLDIPIAIFLVELADQGTPYEILCDYVEVLYYRRWEVWKELIWEFLTGLVRLIVRHELPKASVIPLLLLPFWVSLVTLAREVIATGVHGTPIYPCTFPLEDAAVVTMTTTTTTTTEPSPPIEPALIAGPPTSVDEAAVGAAKPTSTVSTDGTVRLARGIPVDWRRLQRERDDRHATGAYRAYLLDTTRYNAADVREKELVEEKILPLTHGVGAVEEVMEKDNVPDNVGPATLVGVAEKILQATEGAEAGAEEIMDDGLGTIDPTGTGDRGEEVPAITTTELPGTVVEEVPVVVASATPFTEQQGDDTNSAFALLFTHGDEINAAMGQHDMVLVEESDDLEMPDATPELEHAVPSAPADDTSSELSDVDEQMLQQFEHGDEAAGAAMPPSAVEASSMLVDEDVEMADADDAQPALNTEMDVDEFERMFDSEMHDVSAPEPPQEVMDTDMEDAPVISAAVASASILPQGQMMLPVFSLARELAAAPLPPPAVVTTTPQQIPGPFLSTSRAQLMTPSSSTRVTAPTLTSQSQLMTPSSSTRVTAETSASQAQLTTPSSSTRVTATPSKATSRPQRGTAGWAEYDADVFWPGGRFRPLERQPGHQPSVGLMTKWLRLSLKQIREHKAAGHLESCGCWNDIVSRLTQIEDNINVPMCKPPVPSWNMGKRNHQLNLEFFSLQQDQEGKMSGENERNLILTLRTELMPLKAEPAASPTAMCLFRIGRDLLSNCGKSLTLTDEERTVYKTRLW